MRPSLEKLEQLLQETAGKTGLSKTRLMNQAGFDSSQWRRYIRDDRPLSDAMLRGLATLPGWPDYATLLKWKAEDKNPELSAIDGLYKVPLKGNVSAGGLAYIEQMADIVYLDWFGIEEVSNDLFALKVQGQSMWPPIPDGAYLLVREARSFKNKGIYVIETEHDEATIKLVEYAGKGTRLIPLNRDFDDYTVSSHEIRHIYEVLECKFSLQGRTLTR